MADSGAGGPYDVFSETHLQDRESLSKTTGEK
jgi:hypothetical protein